MTGQLKFAGAVFSALSLLAGCEGPAGPSGAAGTPGTEGTPGTGGSPGDAGVPGAKGDPGTGGKDGCDGLPAGAAPELKPTMVVSAPKNGMYFAAGEQITFTITIQDRCARPVDVKSLGTANLYLSGPRAPLTTRAAIKLLNCVTDRMAADAQHHFVNLIAPKFADNAKPNLSAAGNSLVFTTAAISDEAAGTYTAGLWTKSKDEIDQSLLSVEVQIGTATVESYINGTPDKATCFDCHKGTMSGKVYMAHIAPGFAPFGNYALDQTPITNCKLCHNLDGYSPNPLLRKVHGAHRGGHLTTPGVAHPEYGLPDVDASLASFTDVTFPSFPGDERDCVRCHVTDTYLKSPSRLACGTCHDNLFFDSGTLNPPRNFGQPFTGTTFAAGAKKKCASDGDCAGFGNFAVCEVMSGNCLRKSHPSQTDDSKCTTCHTADNQGLSPIAAKHEITQFTRKDGVKLSMVVIAGGTGANGSFKPGDNPVVTFKLENKDGVVNALTNAMDPNFANWAASAVLSGPTEKPFPIWTNTAANSLNVKTVKCPGPNNTTVSCLTFDANTGLYTFTFPIAPGEMNPGWPVSSQAPINSVTIPRQPNVSGTYTFWMWIAETLRPPAPNIANLSWRDVANVITPMRFSTDGTDAPLQPRHIVVPAACNSCHTVAQAHGGSRQIAPGTTIVGCPVCHSFGAEDQGVVGPTTTKCTVDKDCAGNALGYQVCMNGFCNTTKDPSPNQYVDFRVMIHQLHFARKLEGFTQRNNIQFPGKLQINTSEFSEVLLPQDVRNCTKCHADSGAKCDAKTPCGIGQVCTAGACTNDAWMKPSGMVCISCHDTGEAYAHIAINTYQDQSGPIESCQVCHGEGAGFSIRSVHNISDPYKPPYSREP